MLTCLGEGEEPGPGDQHHVEHNLHSCFIEKKEACYHRRRIKTEKKAKVVVGVWEVELIQFLAVLAILHQDDLKNRMNSSISLYHPGAIHDFLHIVLEQNS